MELDEEVDFHELEVDAEKTSMVFLISVVFLGAAIAGSITLEGGSIVNAMLDVSLGAEKWAGVSGSVYMEINDTPESIHSKFIDDEVGGTLELDLRGKVDERHYFGALPFDNSDFEPDRLGNLSLSDLEAGGLFDESDFPTFYPDDSSYEEVRESPDETFESTEQITLFEEQYSALKTTLHDGIPYYLLSYELNGEEQPLFLSSIKDYSSCYDGNSCNHQFMLPEINGSNYHFYMLPEIDPVNVTTFVDGEKNRTFPYPARPYNLTVETRDIFEDNTLDERTIRISEREGNNLFTPAIGSTDYTSEAEVITTTPGGSKSLMFAPTKYSSPGEYELSIEIMTQTGQVGQTEQLFVDRGTIEFTEAGPSEKGFGFRENEYKQGVNHMRPIANCLFSHLSDENAVELKVDANTSELTLSRGVPYKLDVSDADVDYFNLKEPDSHVVLLPGGGNSTSTVHLPGDENPFISSSEVAFTPTVLKSEDDGLRIELLDSQEDLLQEINLTVKDATCASFESGTQIDAPYLKSFKKRVNSIRPVLRSLFVAGN
jgi:hypothetical protein